MKLLAILLTVLFVALKLTHVIAWSWLVVLSPLLGLALLFILALVTAAVIVS